MTIILTIPEWFVWLLASLLGAIGIYFAALIIGGAIYEFSLVIGIKRNEAKWRKRMQAEARARAGSAS